MELASIAEWDSLSVLSVIALLDELFSVKLSYQDYQKCQTVGDIISYVAADLDQ